MKEEVRDNLKLASSVLLVPFGLDRPDLAKALGMMMTRQVDYADLYFQFSRSESWSLEEGLVKSGSFAIDQGVGVRAVCGERTAFAYSDDISRAALEQTVMATRAIANEGRSEVHASAVSVSRGHTLYPPMDPLASLSAESRLAILHRVETLARAKDSRVSQVIAGLSGEYEVILVARHDGHLAADVRPLVRLSVQIIVESSGRREQGYAGGGGRFGYEWFNEERISEYVDAAVHQALVNLDAAPAPAGPMTVVLGAGWPGILLHEAIGHGLEGDFNRKGSSAFSNRIGEKVAASGVTVVDNGTLEGRRGSLNIDDEGNPTSCTTLIEEGILCNYLQDSLNARLMGMAVTGNARRESYAHIPMPRMTNTYMLNGNKEPEEIIASVESGLYAVNFGGGQVDITSGKFVFSAAEAYLIEKGRITRPVKGATLIGNGPDVLTKVSMIGNDMQLDTGIGTCGKEGQSVPVGVGQPTLRIDGLTVGGTA
ncbi:MAG: metalloprotease TldD [Proteobacteria bacterium]|nr:metalloprotease TldD [Pseudomonadota bacterium]MDE3208640.1 metalloprotease TldD [Pseudomonadota bacterium]